MKGRGKKAAYLTVYFTRSLFPGGQSDQGYDSLSKEEERMCGRESENLVEDKGPRQSSEILINPL